MEVSMARMVSPGHSEVPWASWLSSWPCPGSPPHLIVWPGLHGKSASVGVHESGPARKPPQEP